VYEIAVKSVLSTNSHTLSFTDFCIYGQKNRLIQMSHSLIRYDFSIVIHAKLNEMDVKSKKKSYYVEVDLKTMSLRLSEKRWFYQPVT
jgi:hypothetical protein